MAMLFVRNTITPPTATSLQTTSCVVPFGWVTHPLTLVAPRSAGGAATRSFPPRRPYPTFRHRRNHPCQATSLGDCRWWQWPAAAAVATALPGLGTSTNPGCGCEMRMPWREKKKKKAPLVATVKRRGRKTRQGGTLRASHSKRTVAAVRADQCGGRGTSGGSDEYHRQQLQLWRRRRRRQQPRQRQKKPQQQQ